VEGNGSPKILPGVGLANSGGGKSWLRKETGPTKRGKGVEETLTESIEGKEEIKITRKR